MTPRWDTLGHAGLAVEAEGRGNAGSKSGRSDKEGSIEEAKSRGGDKGRPGAEAHISKSIAVNNTVWFLISTEVHQ